MQIGIDLGGTKIAGIALSDKGEVLAYERVETPEDDYAAMLKAVVDLVSGLESSSGQQGTVGIGTPGALSPTTGLMRNSNSTCLNGKPLDQDIVRALGREIRMANDADCFALSEATDGAAAGAASVFGVILGTGVGGGIVVDGHLLSGPNAIAGEWGHNPLPYRQDDERPGNPCYCGKSGCVETFLSGPGMERHHEAATGSFRSSRDIVRSAGSDMAARQSLEQYIDRLARALSVVINIVDPEVIVLGGGMSNIEALYEGVPRRWGDTVFSDTVRTRLVRHYHGDDSGVRGAARLWARGSG